MAPRFVSGDRSFVQGSRPIVRVKRPGPNTRLWSRHARVPHRLLYTASEDEALVRWVSLRAPEDAVQGMLMWFEAERQAITRHTAESMRNRWLRYLAKQAEILSALQRPLDPPKRKRKQQVLDPSSGAAPPGSGEQRLRAAAGAPQRQDERGEGAERFVSSGEERGGCCGDRDLLTRRRGAGSAGSADGAGASAAAIWSQEPAPNGHVGTSARPQQPAPASGDKEVRQQPVPAGGEKEVAGGAKSSCAHPPDDLSGCAWELLLQLRDLQMPGFVARVQSLRAIDFRDL